MRRSRADQQPGPALVLTTASSRASATRPRCTYSPRYCEKRANTLSANRRAGPSMHGMGPQRAVRRVRWWIRLRAPMAFRTRVSPSCSWLSTSGERSERTSLQSKAGDCFGPGWPTTRDRRRPMSRLQQPRLAKAERVLPAGSVRGSALPLPSEPNIFELFERHLIPRDRSAQATSDRSPRLARPGERLDRFSVPTTP
jgi:hypothetical protein